MRLREKEDLEVKGSVKFFEASFMPVRVLRVVSFSNISFVSSELEELLKNPMGRKDKSTLHKNFRCLSCMKL